LQKHFIRCNILPDNDNIGKLKIGYDGVFMKKLLLILCVLFVLFMLVLVINTVRFSSMQSPVPKAVAVEVDEKAVLGRLSMALALPTISHQDIKYFDPAPFLAFRKFLKDNYPLTHRHLARKVINGYALLYEWPGSDPELKPVVLMAHMDVVPVDPVTETEWTWPAFNGKVADGYVWGRGALDMKSTLTGIMEGVENALERGYAPKRTIYLAFGHDEEIGGEQGAGKIAAYLEHEGIRPAATIDEGMVILGKTLSTLKRRTAVIGVAEKGYVTLRITARTRGGHSSMPPHKTTVGTLANAIVKLEQNQMPASLTGAVKLMFDYLGPEMPIFQKVLFANQWVFKGLLEKQLERINSMNAMMRTTTAPTIISGGVKENILPNQAYALVNFRILPGDTAKDVVDHATRVINDSDVTVSIHQDRWTPPSGVSSAETEVFGAITASASQAFGDILIVPGLVTGGTDTKHYTSITDNSYRFFPIILEAADAGRIHGIDERIAVENYLKMVQYYTRLVENLPS
jgi:carboxypeptidase PM20D1